MTTTMIHTRIDAETKEAAKKVCDEIGINMSEAIRVFLRQMVSKQELPVETKIPNRATRKAMKNVLERKNLKEYSWEEFQKEYDL